ncbi:hypothetical protein BAUCODRAFT_149275 [Baudoinia panamericana UAMH 10762]|uniref:Uncharacterized protein n=1 Tax=Baudoinia panamericana (strain UAMH 10762) TaxID=717646 RepID=M2LLT3_BAUPA|nr:uncharacterized protein BAUCODRAFT_149275 [Baudoinia panamericana UAMH 10762]EMC95272.1 hypothetical protein BAUCODRAFT_149275 [Baudoinia panamericana UAMH 10762]
MNRIDRLARAIADDDVASVSEQLLQLAELEITPETIERVFRAVTGSWILVQAAIFEAVEVLEHLLASKAFASKPKAEAALWRVCTRYYFCYYHDEEKAVYIARKLINHGVAVDARNGHGMTPLMLALRSAPKWSSSHSLVSLLIQSGANVNSVDLHGKQPIQYWMDAVNEHCGSMRLVQVSTQSLETCGILLVEAGAKTDVRRQWRGDSPLHVAVRFGMNRLVGILAPKTVKLDWRTMVATHH